MVLILSQENIIPFHLGVLYLFMHPLVAPQKFLETIIITILKLLKFFHLTMNCIRLSSFFFLLF